MKPRRHACRKHVLCEKPVTPSNAELEAIMTVSRETGKVFYPRQNRRWDRDFRIVKKIYDEQLVGRSFRSKAVFRARAAFPATARCQSQRRRHDLDWGVHLLDRLLFYGPGKDHQVLLDLTHITTMSATML
jgi:predicted dehydrogenase